MKTKKLTPRNAAPVQRETNTTSSEGGMGLRLQTRFSPIRFNDGTIPFAGDDAE